MIRRGFLDVPGGQVHYRTAGEGGTPLVMLHASPGSARQLEHLIRPLSAGRRVIALDTRGNGDSTPLPIEAPGIPDFAAATIAALDAAGLARCDLYGTHTGASIAMEVAIAQPQRVRRLVLDGMGLYGVAEQEELLRTYAPAMAPDLEARHLMWAWHFCRDQFVFWPWFKRQAANVRSVGLPAPGALHAMVLEVLKALGSYHMSYRAAFRHPKRERLALLRVPTLACCPADDMLRPHLDEMAALVPGAQKAELPGEATPGAAAASAAIIAGFLDRAE